MLNLIVSYPQTSSSGTLWLVIGALVVFAAFFAYRIINKVVPPGGSGEAHHTEPATQHIPRSSNPDLTTHIIPIIDYFSGCMNDLTNAMNDDDAVSLEITMRNIELVVNGHGDEMLKKWFFSFAHDRNSWSADIYRVKTGQIRQTLIDCGITSSSEKTVTWNNDAARHYRRLYKVEEGQVCDVIAPYWMYKDKVFEQGLVKVNN